LDRAISVRHPIEKFLGSHPAALAFVQTPKPAPSSFGRERYFSVAAFHFAAADGATRFGKYRLVPVAGVEHLNADALKAKTPDYLFDEVKERIGKSPIEFRVLVQLAEAGDVADDSTVHWPADRKLLELGTIKLTQLVPDNAAAQKQIIFDPIPRIDGIEASADPLFELRAALYLLSGRRRRSATA
jgi:catalase